MINLSNACSNLDIRKIQLRKRVSTNYESSAAQWYTWGQYDELVVEQVRPNTSVEHPLQTIWQDATYASCQLNGDYQYFVQYLYRNASSERSDVFWDSIGQFPLLVVSMLYFDKAFWRQKEAFNPETMESMIDDLIQKSPDLNSAMVYNSLDNCDAVIVWSTNSFGSVLQAIKQLYEKNTHLVSSFSTFAYQTRILHETTDELLSVWSNDDRANITIHLHGNHLENVEDVAARVRAYFQNSNVNVAIVAGQDDITLCISNMLLKKYVSVYKESSPLFPQTLLERGVTCNTLIGFNLDPLLLSWKECSQDTGLIEKLIKKLKNSFDESKTAYPPWNAALYEAMNELSSFEHDNTATHIFHQLLGVQSKFIYYLCQSLKNSHFPSSLDNDVIFIYLEKWSHISFHTQKAFWKLTQETDINHLYLFPTKLSLIGTAYAHFASKALTNSYDNEYCSFLLSPVLGHKVNFGPVYIPNREHTRIVYGELPASYIFNPQYLFPLLIHEIAHYVGGDVRQREERSKCCFVSLFMSFCIVVIQSMNISSLDKSEVESLLLKLALTATEFYDNPDRVEQHIQALTQGELLLGAKWQNDIASGAFYQIILSALQDTIASVRFQDIISKTKIASIGKAIGLVTPSDISNRLMHIKYVYRESFSDLCMVRLLKMSPSEYIRCILWNESRTTSKEIKDYIHSPKKRMMVCRIVAVLTLMFKIEGYDPQVLANKISTVMNELDKSDSAYIAFGCLIEELSGRISSSTTTEEQQVKLVLPINSLLLIVYLIKCDKHINQRIEKNDSAILIFNVYKAIVDKPSEPSSYQIYHDCEC